MFDHVSIREKGPQVEKAATLEDAILLAVQAHRGQVEKAGRPYCLHPLRVMFRLESDVERMAGVLHDVVEDTPYSLDDLRQMGYPAEVIEALDCLTWREGESYDQFLDRVKVNPLARRVKIADIEDNMDIRRLLELTDNDVARLRKYRRAWQELKALER